MGGGPLISNRLSLLFFNGGIHFLLSGGVAVLVMPCALFACGAKPFPAVLL